MWHSSGHRWPQVSTLLHGLLQCGIGSRHDFLGSKSIESSEVLPHGQCVTISGEKGQ